MRIVGSKRKVGTCVEIGGLGQVTLRGDPGGREEGVEGRLKLVSRVVVFDINHGALWLGRIV